MAWQVSKWTLLGAVVATALLCHQKALAEGPKAGGLKHPIPVQPWMADQKVEAQFLLPTGHVEVPILPPLPLNGPLPSCMPDRADVLRALPPLPQGAPYLYKESREDIEITTECLKDDLTPARFYPLIGLAHLRHCHYKCTVQFTRVIEASYPIPFETRQSCTEVVYIDRDFIHLVDPARE
jgi:hypothetical protein